MVNKGYGISRIQKEMDKCIVLCLNCHAVLHNGKKENENNKLVPIINDKWLDINLQCVYLFFKTTSMSIVREIQSTTFTCSQVELVLWFFLILFFF